MEHSAGPRMTSRSVPTARSGDGLTRAFLTCGVVGPALFILVFLIEEATRPGYSVVRDFVSSLALGPGGWIQDANFIVYGLLTLAFVVGLRRVISSGPASIFGVGLLGVYALALITAGIFRTDPGQGYPPGRPTLAQPSSHGVIHALAGLVVFVSLSIAILIFTRRFAVRDGWRRWTLYSGLSCVLTLGFFIASVAPSPGWNGILQRVAIITGWVWIALLAVRLLHESRRLTA